MSSSCTLTAALCTVLTHLKLYGISPDSVDIYDVNTEMGENQSFKLTVGIFRHEVMAQAFQFLRVSQGF